jgi:hypothetical protein
MQPYVMTLARWLARKAVKAEWKAMGRRPECADASVIAAYFVLHRNELLKEPGSILLPSSIGTRSQ